MKLSEEQLSEIEKFAGLLLSIEECAVILGVAKNDLCEQYAVRDSVVYLSYQKGFLKTKASLNQSIISLAEQNSSVAQSELLRITKAIENRNRQHDE